MALGSNRLPLPFSVMKKLLILSPLLLLLSCSSPSKPDYIQQVIVTDQVPNLKVSLDVIINQELTEYQIKKAAAWLHTQYPTAENWFISYYLPDMQRGAGAWAVSHGRPLNDVQIIGKDFWIRKEANNE